MKNKIIIGLLAIMSCFTLVGCGNSNNENEDINNPNQGNNQKQNVDDDDVNDNLQIKLYSDDTKLVYNFNDIYKIVYYYSGNKITGLEYYYNYETKEAAKYALTTLGMTLKEGDDGVKSIEQNGTYVVVKFNETEFSDLTVEEIKTTYSYLQQIYKDQ